MKPRQHVGLGSLGALSTAGTVAATILCCLPFASGIVGATLAALGARFAPWRPYLTVVSLGCLGYAIFRTERPACDEGICAPSRGRRFAIWSMAAVVILLLTASMWVNWAIYWTL